VRCGCGAVRVAKAGFQVDAAKAGRAGQGKGDVRRLGGFGWLGLLGGRLTGGLGCGVY
jgi:hypothetical protein